MASVYVTFGEVGQRVQNGILHVFDANGLVSEVVTSSGTSAQSSNAATKRGQIVQIVCATAVYATAASDPTATATNGVYVPANLPTYLVLDKDDKIAVIDVA